MLFSRGFDSKQLFCSRFLTQVTELNHHSSYNYHSLMNSNNIIHVRHKSGSSRWRNRKFEVIKLLVEGDSGGFEATALKRLEETIQNIAIKMAAPAWLPFRPGMSYWVPLHAKLDKAIEIGRSGGHINEDDLRAFATARRGWPSSTFYIGGQGS